jgi:hypothetical protein
MTQNKELEIDPYLHNYLTFNKGTKAIDKGKSFYFYFLQHDAHTCNSSYLGGRDQEGLDLRPAWVKSETPPQPISLVWQHVPVIPTTQEVWVGGSLGEKT